MGIKDLSGTVFSTFQDKDFQNSPRFVEGSLPRTLPTRKQTLYHLKALIEAKTGIAVRDQRIVWHGQELKDNGVTLGSYFDSAPAFQPGQDKTLYLVPRVRRGNLAGKVTLV